MGTGEFNTADNPAIDQHPIQGGEEILLVTSRYRNQEKLLLNLVSHLPALTVHYMYVIHSHSIGTVQK